MRRTLSIVHRSFTSSSVTAASTAAYQPSIDDIKTLRRSSSAPIKDCKQALVDAQGHFPDAFEYLRKKGIATATAKSGRSAAQGLVAISVSEDARHASLLEVNSETDFVARNDTFQAFVTRVNTSLLALPPTDAPSKCAQALLTVPLDETTTVGDLLPSVVGQLGEHIRLRRSTRIDVIDGGCVAHYLHNGRDNGRDVGQIGAVVALAYDPSRISRAGPDLVHRAGTSLAMHVVAANPTYLEAGAVPEAVVSRERALIRAQTRRESATSPKKIVEQITRGRLGKFYGQVCLLQQAHMIERDHPVVASVLDTLSREVETPVSVSAYVRFQVGEDLDDLDAAISGV